MALARVVVEGSAPEVAQASAMDQPEFIRRERKASLFRRRFSVPNRVFLKKRENRKLKEW